MKKGWMRAMVAVSAMLWVGVALGADAGVLRLLSYNVRHCSGREGPIHYSQTAAAIQREAPDFVGLQEIDVGTNRSKGVDQGASDHKPVFVSVAVAPSLQGKNLQKGK